MADSKALKRYEAGVERALGLFDASNEWADYIAFLSRLLKALQASPAGAEIPSKTILAKYLAQCLRPSLPSGVHQKALEAYGLIFSTIGTQGLTLDLPLYFPGFAHTLSFASLSTRPWFLALFDEHILNLPAESLRSALKAILLSLLPGIEEENSEDFKKTLATIDRVREIFVEDDVEDVFWQSMFLASVTSSNRRMGVLIYLTKYLPPLGPTPPAENNPTTGTAKPVPISTVTTPEPGLLIRCFATGLKDEQPLVQRGFLDLLVTLFPLNSSIIQETASPRDIDILFSAALGIVLKRDMGLNRRLWAWLFGNDEKTSYSEEAQRVAAQKPNTGTILNEQNSTGLVSSSEYFLNFGQRHVIQVFYNMIAKQAETPSSRAKPFRIMVSLMDRSAIGAPVVSRIFPDLLTDLMMYQKGAPSQDAFDEVFRSASVLFDSIDPQMIARHLLDLFRNRKLDLLDFVLLNFALDDEEMLQTHLPLIVSVMSHELAKASSHSASAVGDALAKDAEMMASGMGSLLQLLPSQHVGEGESGQTEKRQDDLPKQIYRLYDTASTTRIEVPAALVAEADYFSLHNVIHTILNSLEHNYLSPVQDLLILAFDKLYSRIGTTGSQDYIRTLLDGIAKCRIQEYFDTLKSIYQPGSSDLPSKTVTTENPERSITNLLVGLEYFLARAHSQVIDAARPTSGQDLNAAEIPQSRAVANNRLTVVLCMQDAIKICGAIWCWRLSKAGGGDTKSFNYLSSKLRVRTRRMLEHLTNAEPQECLETLISLWVQAVKLDTQPRTVMSLLQTLEAARPKFMMPAVFNAVYNRTNPHALDQSQKSTMSVNLSSLELLAFLIEYVESLEDDLLEEIWSDCTSFIREILTNPMPHRQLLLRLIDFASILCQKMENTTFGEQARMRRELSDLSTRLFTAVFAIKPTGFDSTAESGPKDQSIQHKGLALRRFDAGEGVQIFCEALPMMAPILSEGDRLVAVFSGISTNIIMPLIKAKPFPRGFTHEVIRLLLIMSKTPAAAKIWKKDLLEAFNHPSFFDNVSLSDEDGWLSVLKQLVAAEKGLMSELLARLTAPTTAGIVFGVGAATARAEADKQTRLNLRRIALVLLAANVDTFASSLSQTIARLDELLLATPSTSPSSATRGDVYLLVRAICLSFTQVNLVAIWPSVNSELRALFEDLSKTEDAKLSTASHLQGAKLLDLLLLLKLEEFQLQEWLFITDTIDAIYPPANTGRIAAADSLQLDNTQPVELSSGIEGGLRKPLLSTDASRRPSEQRRLLGSFFSNLSIRAFEDTYGLEAVDVQACKTDILLDLFTPVKKPVGAFRAGLFGFLLGTTVAGASVYYYILEEYKVSNEVLSEDIFALQAAVQRTHAYVLELEKKLDEKKK
ncbi:hypothetical protein DV738_g1168, partial [Chaetothyriales sp. CBS 135597]